MGRAAEGFVQVERSLMDYISDQWPTAYFEMIKNGPVDLPEVEPQQGYEWVPACAIEYLEDQWPSAYEMMMCKASKSPAIIHETEHNAEDHNDAPETE